MRAVGAADLIACLDSLSLIDALAAAFREGVVTPLRHHHTLKRDGEPDAVLLMMPAWTGGADAYLGVKLVTVFPGNAARGAASVMGSYVLMSGDTGAPLAVLDGTTLTLLRTAAASALAARFLAREDASRLLMVGAGAMAPHLIAAHASVRPIREVAIWNRDPVKAEALAMALAGRPYRVRAVTDLDAAIAEAEIVSSATMSREPLVGGRFLQPGTHVDLVGAYTPEMRESDDEAIRRARIFVDTREGAMHEAGDIVQPLRSGILSPERIEADLFDFARGRHPGRASDDEITLFKSVGTALEDLAAARLAWQRFKTPA